MEVSDFGPSNDILFRNERELLSQTEPRKSIDVATVRHPRKKSEGLFYLKHDTPWQSSYPLMVRYLMSQAS